MQTSRALCRGLKPHSAMEGRGLGSDCEANGMEERHSMGSMNVVKKIRGLCARATPLSW